MKQADVIKTPIRAPKDEVLMAIDRIVDNAVDMAFAECCRAKKDIRGSIDVNASKERPGPEHSITGYSRLGFDLRLHGCRTICVMVGNVECKIKIHAAVVDYNHRGVEAVGRELVDDIAKGILHGMPDDKREASIEAALSNMVLEYYDYFTKPMVYEQAKRIGIENRSMIDKVINTLLEDNAIVLRSYEEEPKILDEEMPGMAFRRADVA